MTTVLRFAPILIALIVFMPLHAVAAVIFVGNGTAASCTETTLKAALVAAGAQGGGSIFFRCGKDLVVISMTAELVVPHNTTIDGGGRIILDGGISSSERSFRVDRGATVTLKDLRIRNGGGFTRTGGGIFNQGTLTIRGSTFSDNLGADGGAIHNEGTLTVLGSVFARNGAGHGGSIGNFGTATIYNSIFFDNFADQGGGIYSPGGTLSVFDSTFVNNDAGTGGGAINASGLTVRGSQFAGNTAESGGAILTGGGDISDSNFFNNGVVFGGGAIANGGNLTVVRSTFVGNRTEESCGGGFRSSGAGLSNRGGALTVNASSIFSNHAGLGAGDGCGGGIFNAGTLSVTNSTITHNTAGIDGGGIFTSLGGTPPSLQNTVVMENEPDDIVP